MKSDLPRYILDSFGLLAYFGAEPGESQIKTVLTRATAGQAATYLSVINLGEVAYITEREQGASAARRTLAAIDQLPIKIIEADRRLALAAAHVKAHYPISFAEAFVVALAQQMQAVILTGDPEFSTDRAPGHGGVAAAERSADGQALIGSGSIECFAV